MLCQFCSKNIKGTCLYGWGNKKSPIMFIGDAPARQEIAQKEPFCGKAGKILEEILSELNISKSSLYITNAVCYYPTTEAGELRNPENSEIFSCRSKLRKEIEEVNPKIIIALGLPSFFALTGLEGKMGSLRGRKFQTLPSLGNYIVTPSWHPSFIVKGMVKFRPQLFNDIQKGLVEVGLIESKTNSGIYKTLLDFGEIISYIKEIKESKQLLAFDFETTGGHISETILIGLSFCYKEDEAVYIPLVQRDPLGDLRNYHDEENHGKIIEAIKDLLSSDNNPKTAFNSKYEDEVSQFQLNCKVARIVIDPMITYYLRNPDEKIPNLEFMETFHFPESKTKKAEIKRLGLKDYSHIPLKDIGIYGAEDSYWLWKIAIKERVACENTRGYTVSA